MSYPPPPPFDPNQSNSNDSTAPYQPPSPYQPPVAGQPGAEPPTTPYGQPPQSVPPAPSPYDPQSAPPAAPAYRPGQATPYPPQPGYPPPPEYGGQPGYPPPPEYGGQPGYPPPPGGYPGGPVMPGGQPPKKSRTPMIIGIVVAVALLLCAGCGGVGWLVYDRAKTAADGLPTTLPSFDTPSVPTDGPTGSTGGGTGVVVKYEVTGSGEASITYTGADGHTVQDTVTLPWSKQITTQEGFFLASVIVLQLGERKDLTCRVTADGKELRSRTAQGVVSCTGFTD